MAPDGTTLMDNARYGLENGPEIVRLNFTHTILSDNGIWRCEVIVESEHYGVSNGRLSPFDSSIIGQPLEVDIQLTIIGKFQCIHMKVQKIYLPAGTIPKPREIPPSACLFRHSQCIEIAKGRTYI